MLPGEPFRDALVREIAEELGLREGADYAVAPGPVARLGYTAWSQGAQAETRYETELFEVEPGEDALRSLDGDASVRWLDESEVRSSGVAGTAGRSARPWPSCSTGRGCREPGQRRSRGGRDAWRGDRGGSVHARLLDRPEQRRHLRQALAESLGCGGRGRGPGRPRAHGLPRGAWRRR